MANISRDSFNESKQYDKVILQQGAPLTDYDFNEAQDLIRARLRNVVTELVGNGAVGQGWQVVGTGATNNFTVRSGVVYAKGYRVLLGADSTASTLGVTLTTPATNRTDKVFLELYEVEVDSVTDPSIRHPKLQEVGIEPTRRIMVRADLRVAEGGTVPSDTSTRFYIPLATISRTTSSIVTAGMVVDDRQQAGSHTHGSITFDGRVGAISGLPIITTTGGLLTVGSFGTTTGTFCQGDDARLTNARTPVVHASSHATGGSDVLTPAAIGAANAAHGAHPTTDQAAALAGTSGTPNDTNRYVTNTDSRLTDARPAGPHTHGNVTNAGAIGSTANIPIITGASGVLQAGAFGTTANTFCQGDDSRLSNARTPTAHNHIATEITSGTLAVDRGGTGIASYTTGNYIRASGATTLEQRTPAQVATDIGITFTTGDTRGIRNITASTAAPSGGSDGDVWLRYT